MNKSLIHAHPTGADASRFLLAGQHFEPAYLALHRRGELKRRVAEVLQSLAHCEVCPRDCGVDRLADETGVCKTGRYARVSSYFPHFGEEDCLRGWQGSGTIFFAWCNLRCVFCQNYQVSQEGEGVETPPTRLAAMMLELQAEGCHNVIYTTAWTVGSRCHGSGRAARRLRRIRPRSRSTASTTACTSSPTCKISVGCSTRNQSSLVT